MTVLDLDLEEAVVAAARVERVGEISITLAGRSTSVVVTAVTGTTGGSALVADLAVLGLRVTTFLGVLIAATGVVEITSAIVLVGVWYSMNNINNIYNRIS